MIRRHEKMIASVYKGRISPCTLTLKSIIYTMISREDVIAYMDDSSDDECEMNRTNRRVTVPCSAMDR